MTYKYDIEIEDIDGDAVAILESATEDKGEVEFIFNAISPTGGAKMYLKRIEYDDEDQYKYTSVELVKDSTGKVIKYED